MKTAESKKQMELSLETRANNRRRRAKRTARRAGWWFSQMRTAVDPAIDWTPRPAPPAHQAYFALDQQSPNWWFPANQIALASDRLALSPNLVSSHPRRRRQDQKSKEVSTTDELVIHRILIAIFIVTAVSLAAYLTMVLSRRWRLFATPSGRSDAPLVSPTSLKREQAVPGGEPPAASVPRRTRFEQDF
jgi:hypothetical protein